MSSLSQSIEREKKRYLQEFRLGKITSSIFCGHCKLPKKQQPTTFGV
jgi:hypothetical protein